MENIPKGCGYNQHFKYSVYLADHGVDSALIEWCEDNCKKKWGWWFEPLHDDNTFWDPEQQAAYMSFQDRREAMRFWFIKDKLRDN